MGIPFRSFRAHVRTLPDILADNGRCGGLRVRTCTCNMFSLSENISIHASRGPDMGGFWLKQIRQPAFVLLPRQEKGAFRFPRVWNAFLIHYIRFDLCDDGRGRVRGWFLFRFELSMVDPKLPSFKAIGFLCGFPI